jgi:phosphatidate phosphatase APP1
MHAMPSLEKYQMYFYSLLLISLSLSVGIDRKLTIPTPFPFGTILIPGMAEKLSSPSPSLPSKSVYKVYTKGRLSTPISNKAVKDMVIKYGHPAIDETASGIENFKNRVAYFRTSALQNFTITLEFQAAIVVETNTQFSRSDIWVGSDGNFKAEIVVEIDQDQKDIHYNVEGGSRSSLILVPEVSTYATLTENEGFAIITDLDDTIKETGICPT